MSAQLQHYHRKRAEMIKLLGGKCKHCGATENLEFDHVDRDKKEFNISRLYGLSMDKLKPELDKCQILCKPCHLEKTREVDGLKMVHGKDSMYRHAKCRCVPCKEAHSKVMADYQRKKMAELGPGWRARDRKKQPVLAM